MKNMPDKSEFFMQMVLYRLKLYEIQNAFRVLKVKQFLSGIKIKTFLNKFSKNLTCAKYFMNCSHLDGNLFSNRS